jgi:Putative SAM-dependent methyltransferase
LSGRFEVPFVPRKNLVDTAANASTLYVVGTEHEQVLDVATGQNMHVQQGLLTIKVQQGLEHPFIRAVLGDDDMNTPLRIIDATLGLAGDALHVAHSLPAASIIGIERSPLMHALLEEGLVRLSKSMVTRSATAIELRGGDASDELAAMADDSVDVVMLDPMMSRPRPSAPSMSLLRTFAWPAPASPALLLHAARVARRRVVLKLGRGAPLPPGCPLRFESSPGGRAVAYYVHTVRGG